LPGTVSKSFKQRLNQFAADLPPLLCHPAAGSLAADQECQVTQFKAGLTAKGPRADNFVLFPMAK
jgi:hypothetical protein